MLLILKRLGATDFSYIVHYENKICFKNHAYLTF